MTILDRARDLLDEASTEDLRKIIGMGVGLISKREGYTFKPVPCPAAELAVGESVVILRRFWNRDKEKARRLLGDPKAQWKANALAAPEGKYRTRVTRVK